MENIKKRNMFAGKNKEELEVMLNELEKICGKHYSIKKYLDNYVLVANDSLAYNAGIIAGNVIATDNGYDVKWIGTDRNLHELNKVCVCNCCFTEDVFNNENLDAALKLYAKNLSEYLFGIPVTYNFLERQNGCYCYIKFTDLFLEEKRQLSLDYISYCASETLDVVQRFVKKYKLPRRYKDYGIEIKYSFVSNFLETAFAEVKEENENVKKALYTFYERTAFFRGLKQPVLFSMLQAPEISNSVCKHWHFHQEVKQPEIKRLDSDIFLGNNIHVTYFYESNDTGAEIVTPDFKMTDKSNVSAIITKASDTLLTVQISALVKRAVDGKKILENTEYDNLYKFSEYKDSEFFVTATDYYEIISENMLLHYTDISKYYEVVKIPFGFEFEEGVNVKLGATLYNKSNPDWINYKEISEVKEFLLKEKKYS